jgi:hypothetical protein
LTGIKNSGSGINKRNELFAGCFEKNANLNPPASIETNTIKEAGDARCRSKNILNEAKSVW